jgi:hypothetical protein
MAWRKRFSCRAASMREIMAIPPDRCRGTRRRPWEIPALTRPGSASTAGARPRYPHPYTTFWAPRQQIHNRWISPLDANNRFTLPFDRQTDRKKVGATAPERRYTKDGQSPYAEIPFRVATSEIRNPDGSIVFRLEDIDVPSQFSQVASDILAQKYFRKAGVPARLKPVEENTVPSWLWRSGSRLEALPSCPKTSATAPRSTRRQVFDRLAGTWTYWGWKGGYFDRRRRPRLLRRAALHARHPEGRAELARSGSTPACTGPMASTVPARATSMSISRPAS